MNFKMTLSYSMIVDRKDHVQYLAVSKSYSRQLSCSLTERNIAINDHNDAMLLYRSIQIQNKTQPLKKVMILLKEHTLYTKY